MDENGVIGPPGGTHNSSLVDVFDVSSLKGEAVDDNGEVRYLPAIFFKSLWAFDGIGSFILMEAVLEVFDGGLASGSYGVEVGAMFSFLQSESLHKLTIPSCLGCGQCLIDVVLGVVSLLSQGGDEVLVSILLIDGAMQLFDSSVSDVLGQGSNGLDGELISPVVDEGEGALGVDDGDLR